MPEDAAITDEMIQAICEKIPRPYSFYEAIIVLDGVDWFGDCNLSPAIEWSVVKEEQQPGNWPNEPTIDEAFSEYQSNSIRLAKRFDVGLELNLQIELTDTRGMEDAFEIINIFAEQFGNPVKEYVRARESFEERSTWRKRSEKKFLHRFEKEAVPEIVKIYGETPEIFTQPSYARDYIHNQRCIAGIIEVYG